MIVKRMKNALVFCLLLAFSLSGYADFMNGGFELGNWSNWNFESNCGGKFACPSVINSSSYEGVYSAYFPVFCYSPGHPEDCDYWGTCVNHQIEQFATFDNYTNCVTLHAKGDFPLAIWNDSNDVFYIWPNNNWTKYNFSVGDGYHDVRIKVYSCELTGVVYLDDIETAHCGNETLDLPDLLIAPADIRFSQDLPKRGETVNITAAIHNIGGANATNVSVKFYDATAGQQISNYSMIPEIAANQSQNVSILWTVPAEAELGPHEIYVIADPDDNITEENENNNEASKNITLSTYRVLVVPAYFSDETKHDIQQYENHSLKIDLDQTTKYYARQSYGYDYIAFSNPVYLNMSHESSHYGDHNWNIIDFNLVYYYQPSVDYAKDLCNTVNGIGYNIGEYDAILGYQTGKAYNLQAGEKYRAVTYSTSETSNACGRKIALLSIDTGYGTFSHELGHAIYNFSDFYNGAKNARGDIGLWGLMGKGNTLDPPAPIISFNKVKAGWLVYNEISENQLLESKRFNLTALEDMRFGNSTIKLTNILGLYDFIIEARKTTPGDYKGVEIYCDTNLLFWQSLNNLLPQNSLVEEPDKKPTLYSNSTIYRHIPTGLKFEYLNESTNASFKCEVGVSFYVNDLVNMHGFILDFLNPLNYSGNSTQSSLDYVGGVVNKHNFSCILPSVELSINENGRVKHLFGNHCGVDILVNKVEITNLVGKSRCKIDTALPIKVRNYREFYIESSGCIPYTYNDTSFEVEISYDSFYDNGSLFESNKTEKGQIHYRPNDFRGRSINVPSLLDILLVTSLIIFLLVGFYLIIQCIRHGKYKKILILWIILFIVLLAYGLFLLRGYMLVLEDQKNYLQNEERKSSFPADSAPLYNLTSPDLDLHAYTSDGLHTGMNYTTGVYENNIPGAVASGDMVGEEWIFVPSNLSVHFVVDSRRVREYLDEINSSENLSLNYSLESMVYGSNPSVAVVNGSVVILDRAVGVPVNGTIGPGVQQSFDPGCAVGGLTVCGKNYCCGVADGVCPTQFSGVSCSVSDPDCVGCTSGGVTVCGVTYCCGAADGVCPSDFNGVSCSTSDVDCV